MRYLRSIFRGLFLADQTKREDEAASLVDTQLSIFAYSTEEERRQNAVAIRGAVDPGDFFCVELDDTDFEALGIATAKTPGTLGVPAVDDRHFVIPVDLDVARLLVDRIRARMTERTKVSKRELRAWAKEVAKAIEWPPADHWLMK